MTPRQKKCYMRGPAASLTLSYRRLQTLVSLVYVKFHRVEHYAVKWLLQCGGTHGQLE
jgi:hypothetical protein